MRRLPSLGFALFGLAVVAAPLGAQQPVESGVHVVDPGDTLWDLARRYFSDPFRWPEIFDANRASIADPDRIYPAERLVIPGPGAALAGTPADRTPPAAAPDVTGAPVPVGRTVFFGDGGGGAMEGPRVVGAAEVSASAITAAAFYGAGLLIPDSVVFEVGRLAEPAARTVIPLRNAPQIQLFDRVYMTLSANASVGDRVQLLRPDGLVEGYGRIFHSTGVAEVVAVDGNVATVEVQVMYDAVAPGDVAVPVRPFEDVPEGSTTEASGLQGVLLALETPQPVVGREDLAFMNLGAASGVVEGDEFMIYIPPTEAEWGIRPGVDVARVQVVRAELNTSAVRVISMEHPAIEVGLPVRLVARNSAP